MGRGAGLTGLKGGGTVLKRTDSSEKAAMLHQLLKLTNRLMAPFSTHLAHRYKISLNEFRLLMTIGNLGRSASSWLAVRPSAPVVISRRNSLRLIR